MALEGFLIIYERKGELSEVLVEIWSTALSQLTQAELRRGVEKYLLSNSPSFPKPGQIYALARPEHDAVVIEAEAQRIANLVFDCLSYGDQTYGGNYPSSAERARTKMGEIGWQYIQACGGWSKFVQGFAYDGATADLATAKAQARKMIIGLLQNQSTAKNQAPDRLTADNTPRRLSDFSLELKSIKQL